MLRQDTQRCQKSHASHRVNYRKETGMLCEGHFEICPSPAVAERHIQEYIDSPSEDERMPSATAGHLVTGTMDPLESEAWLPESATMALVANS